MTADFAIDGVPRPGENLAAKFKSVVAGRVGVETGRSRSRVGEGQADRDREGQAGQCDADRADVLGRPTK